MCRQEEIPPVRLLEASFTPQDTFTGACSAPSLGWALGTLMSQASPSEPLAQRRQPHWLHPLPSPGLWAGLQDLSLGLGQLWLLLNEAVAWKHTQALTSSA